jgi:hypothetical protein
MADTDQTLEAGASEDMNMEDHEALEELMLQDIEDEPPARTTFLE